MLKNITTNKKIVSKISIMKNIFQKANGLMFRLKFKDEALVFPFPFEQTTSLHMMFVFFPIDVLFLDQNKKIVEIKSNFKPWSVYTPKNKSKYVIELPKGKSSLVKLNDQISW